MATDLRDQPGDAPGGDVLAGLPRRRRRLVAIGALVVTFVVAAGLSASRARPEADGVTREGAAPSFDLARVGEPGQRVTLAEFAGRPLVVNFWASWCVPCRTEMPALDATAERMAGRVGFVGVNFQDSDIAAAKFERQVGVRYPSGSDPDGAVGRAYGVMGLPTTVLVDGSGRIVARRLGKVTEADLAGLIERAFGLAVTGGAR